MPAPEEVDGFLDSVSEVSRLIDGLKAGSISPEYVDSVLLAKTGQAASAARQDVAQHAKAADQSPAGSDGQAGGAGAPPGSSADDDADRQARLAAKVEELKANRARKLAARARYQQYVAAAGDEAGTDYRKWDMWCPSDDEDALFNSLTPADPQFQAMEKDINDRHRKWVVLPRRRAGAAHLHALCWSPAAMVS